MKKIYIAPVTHELALCSEHLLAGSPDKVFQSVGGDQLSNRRDEGWNSDDWSHPEED